MLRGMKYLLMIYGNEELWSSFTEEQMTKAIKDTGTWHAGLRESGEFVGAYGMADPVMTRIVQIQDGIVTLQVADNVRMRYALSAIQTVLADEDKKEDSRAS